MYVHEPPVGGDYASAPFMVVVLVLVAFLTDRLMINDVVVSVSIVIVLHVNVIFNINYKNLTDNCTFKMKIAT